MEGPVLLKQEQNWWNTYKRKRIKIAHEMNALKHEWSRSITIKIVQGNKESMHVKKNTLETIPFVIDI